MSLGQMFAQIEDLYYVYVFSANKRKHNVYLFRIQQLSIRSRGFFYLFLKWNFKKCINKLVCFIKIVWKSINILNIFFFVFWHAVLCYMIETILYSITNLYILKLRMTINYEYNTYISLNSNDDSLSLFFYHWLSINENTSIFMSRVYFINDAETSPWWKGWVKGRFSYS